jgi:anti-sigma B factor antagonist
MTNQPESSASLLNITERQVQGVAILDLEGNLIMGGGSTLLRDAIRRLIAEGKKNILLNFGGIKYVDSSGIGELVSGLVAISREEGHLKLSNLTERIEEVMTLSSLRSLFEIYSDESQALDTFQ